MGNFYLSEQILERFQIMENELGTSEHVVKLNCNILDTWEFRDRKPFELGNIEQLASSIKHGGQCQPIIVVKASNSFKPKDDASAQYVVIAGYRRWMACKKYNMEVQAIIKNMTFEQAITVLVAENEKENVSDYSKGMFYHSLLTTEKISQDELRKRLNISPSVLDNYLSFARIDPKIWEAVGDLSRVSVKTAVTIRSIADKGMMYVEALLSIANKIAHGYGEKRIQEAVDSIIDKKLKRAPLVKAQDHLVKFNGKTIMKMHQGRIKLDNSLVNNEHYNELITQLEKDITEFAHFYLKEK